MKVKVIKVSQEKILETCKDFAKLEWPKGATDYAAGYSNRPSTVIVGRHVYGWNFGIKRERTYGWNIPNGGIITDQEINAPKPGQIIWVKIIGKLPRNDYYEDAIEMLNKIMSAVE